MNLWIRSQDKEKLIKVSILFVEYNGDVDPTMSSHRIVADKCIDLGIYKSKERALEVLDEINNIKWYKYMAELSWDNFIKTIYAMPQSEMTKLFLNMNTYEMPKE